MLDRSIRDIALRLNKGRKIDWENDSQEKYRLYIYYDPKIKEVSMGTRFCSKQVFCHFICLDEAFAEVVKTELHQELKEYFELKTQIEENK